MALEGVEDAEAGLQGVETIGGGVGVEILSEIA
jgi:hypothetical protein